MTKQKKVKAVKHLQQKIGRLNEQIKKARRGGSLDTGILEQQRHEAKVMRTALLHIWPGGVRKETA